MNTSPTLLGIDGGGTSTTAWLADAEGNVVGRGVAGPSNIKAIGGEAARRALDDSIARAFADAGHEPIRLASACLGLAGFDREEDKAWLRRWSDESLRPERLTLFNDGDLVLASGTPAGWGVAVIAGTGSIVVGRSPAGESSRAGGWGYLLGDEGSGFDVAVTALRLVARAADGRAGKSPGTAILTSLICQALKIDDPSKLVSAIHGPEFDRARIAALATAVTAADEAGSKEARKILQGAGFDLAQAVNAVVRKLGFDRSWGGPPWPLALAGGFLLAAPVVAESLIEHIESYGATIVASRVDEPVRGAIILARRALIA